MPSIKREWYEIIKDLITEAQEQITAQLITRLFSELPGISVQELEGDFFEKMRQLREFAIELSSSLKDDSSYRPDLDAALVPLFKTLVLRARLAKARECDQQRSKTAKPQAIAALEERRKRYDGIIRETWFQEAIPEYPPSLQDYLTLERIEKLEIDARFQERQYDEKFHLLQAPSLFLPDLHFYRSKCGVRDIPVAITFMDIDKFKDFNTEVGHINVDRNMLPEFMRLLETHIYGHGYAYRMSGDEYALLMPNTDTDLALIFMKSLRQKITTLRFRGIDMSISLSIGLCVVDRDCFLTDEELLQKAQQAMSFAKNEGRDRVAGYADKLFDENKLKILAPTMTGNA
jgi:diguanylate cyclase (GGDEF)-like protein